MGWKVRMNGMKGEDEWDKIFTKVRVYGMALKTPLKAA